MNEVKGTVYESKGSGIYHEPILQLTFFAEQDIVTFSVSGDPDAEPDFEE